jgi:hypothetical protein
MPYAWRLWRLLRASKSAGVVESLCRSVSVPHNFCPAGRQGFPERPSQIPCLPLFRYHLADAPLGAKANLAGVDLKLLVLRLPRIGSKRLDVVVTPAAFAIKNRMANVERRNLIECQIETLQGAAAIDPVATCVGIDWRIFGRHEAIRSCGEVNDLIVWFLGEGLPSVDLAHGDLS